MESKKKEPVFLKILAVLFILYLSLTIAISSGYYEAKLSEKATITDEAMKQFEEDVRAGKNVDIKDYLTDIKKDYSNGATKLGSDFSKIIEKFMSKGINELINIFKILFT